MARDAYDDPLSAYAEELQAFLAPPDTRGRAMSADDLVDQADVLANLSTSALKQATAYLETGDAAERLGAEQHLLAQAAASLQVADLLLAAAADAGEIEQPEAVRAVAGPAVATDDLLAVLAMPVAEAGAAAMASVAEVRGVRSAISGDQLVDSASATLDELLESATGQGRDALAGLLGLDVALLKQAAGLISGELQEVVEKLGEKVSRLVGRAMTFLLQAYDSLLAALGQEATSALRARVAGWLQSLQEGEALTGLLGVVYQVDVTREKVRTVVADSQASGDRLADTQALVVALPEGFEKRTKLANQLLAALGVVRRFPAAKVPMVELASAAVYLLTLGFIIFVGGDYADAPKLERLGRVPGVLHVIEEGLAG